MERQEWLDSILEKSVRQISYRNNMSDTEIQELKVVLSDFLEEGIQILTKWRKIKNESDFYKGDYDSGLILFVKNKYSANGRELYSDYTSGGIKTTMDKTPESVLKSNYKQVI